MKVFTSFMTEVVCVFCLRGADQTRRHEVRLERRDADAPQAVREGTPHHSLLGKTLNRPFGNTEVLLNRSAVVLIKLFADASLRWCSREPTSSPSRSWRSWSATSRTSWTRSSRTAWTTTCTSTPTWRTVTSRTEKDTTISVTTWMKTTPPEASSARRRKRRLAHSCTRSSPPHLKSKAAPFWNFMHFLFNYS